MATELTGPLRTVALVAAVAIGAAVLVTGTYELSRDRIAANERTRMLAGLRSVAGSVAGRDELRAVEIALADAVTLAAGDPTALFVLVDDGAPRGLVFAVTAPDGYNGPIRLLVGVTPAGTITGVRVVSHRETPGLGDYISSTRSDWIAQFTGRSLANPPIWAVDKDGGTFDSLTGATVTPRAVIGAIRRTLAFYDMHGESLYAAALATQSNANEGVEDDER